MAALRWVLLLGVLVSASARAQGGGQVFVDLSVGATGGYSRLLGEQVPLYGISIRSGTNFMTSYTSGISAIFGVDLHFPSPVLFGAGLGYTLFPFGDWVMIRGGAMIFGFATLQYELAVGPELEIQFQPTEWPLGIVVRGGGLIGILASDSLIGRATVGIVWKQG